MPKKIVLTDKQFAKLDTMRHMIDSLINDIDEVGEEFFVNGSAPWYILTAKDLGKLLKAVYKIDRKLEDFVQKECVNGNGNAFS